MRRPRLPIGDHYLEYMKKQSYRLRLHKIRSENIQVLEIMKQITEVGDTGLTTGVSWVGCVFQFAVFGGSSVILLALFLA